MNSMVQTPPPPLHSRGTDAGGKPYLELRNIRKAYGGVVALRDVSLTIDRPGVVHALAGENGSGKSTLLGILSGQIAPDAGELRLEGSALNLRRPADAVKHGICMVSQETSVAGDLTVAENIFLGRLKRNAFGVVDMRRTRRAAEAILANLAPSIDPRATVGTLRPDHRQMVEIARALSMDAKVLILDEPTSSLSAGETDALLKVVHGLRDTGVTTLFVSHRMAEVFDLADGITVIRDGIVALSGPLAEQSQDTLVSAMLGPTKTARAAEMANRDRHAKSVGQPVLEIDALCASGAFDDVDVTVHAGEVVGLAGLEGSGRSELLESLFGERALSSGSVRVEGTPFVPSTPRAAIDSGLAYLPPDRKGQGLILSMSIAGNASIVGTLSRSRARRPSRREAERLVTRLTDLTSLRMGSPDDLVSTLSGGNQQKVALGKWLADGKKVLLLDEPTRGVDIGAKLEIHELLWQTAAEGAALLVSSSENEELLALCDRIIVMARRRVVASLSAGEATLERVTRIAREGIDDNG